LARAVWSSTSITFRVTPLDLVKPNFLFQIKGFTTKITDLIRDLVTITWHDAITREFVASILDQIPDCERPHLTTAIKNFIDSAYVTRLDTRDSGNVLAPCYNIYAKSALIPNDSTWSLLRMHLANRQYIVPMQGEGTTKITLFHCGLCHGIDHPRGLCLFPEVEGWNGPKSSQSPPNRNRNGRGKGRFQRS
jgi:hypothetical protein